MSPSRLIHLPPVLSSCVHRSLACQSCLLHRLIFYHLHRLTGGTACLSFGSSVQTPVTDPGYLMRIQVIWCRSRLFDADPGYLMRIQVILCGSRLIDADPVYLMRIQILKFKMLIVRSLFEISVSSLNFFNTPFNFIKLVKVGITKKFHHMIGIDLSYGSGAFTV